MDTDDRYTLTIYTAAPGTKRVDPDKPDVALPTSLTGHMYLETAQGADRQSAGWQPSEPLEGGGYLGKVVQSDTRAYQEPYYARTMEITKEQYDKIREYSAAPLDHGFNAKYDAFTNSCTDFSWGALNHAGLHGKVGPVSFKDFEGIIQPIKNIRAIQSIDAPFPDSPLNKEERNPMPERDWRQFLFSDNDRAMMDQVNRGVASLDADHGRAPDEASERMCGSLFCLAKDRGLSRVDHVLLSKADAQGQSGSNVFVVQGDPSDPAHLRASMPTAVAAQTPVHESMQQAERITQSQQVAEAQQQTQAQAQEQQVAAQRMA